MNETRLRSLRARLGSVRSRLKEEVARGSGRWLVPQEWLVDALETRALELEVKIVEHAGVKDDTTT